MARENYFNLGGGGVSNLLRGITDGIGKTTKSLRDTISGSNPFSEQLGNVKLFNPSTWSNIAPIQALNEALGFGKGIKSPFGGLPPADISGDVGQQTGAGPDQMNALLDQLASIPGLSDTDIGLFQQKILSSDPTQYDFLASELSKKGAVGKQGQQIDQGIAGLEAFLGSDMIKSLSDAAQGKGGVYSQLTDKNAREREGAIRAMKGSINPDLATSIAPFLEAETRGIYSTNLADTLAKTQTDFSKIYTDTAAPIESLVSQYRAGKPVDFTDFTKGQDIASGFTEAELNRSDLSSLTTQQNFKDLVSTIFGLGQNGIDTLLSAWGIQKGGKTSEPQSDPWALASSFVPGLSLGL